MQKMKLWGHPRVNTKSGQEPVSVVVVVVVITVFFTRFAETGA